MFHPDIVAARIADIESKHLVESHGGKLIRYSVNDARAFVKHLASFFDPETGQWTRGLNKEESDYLRNERVLTKLDWRYWAERYVMIRKEGARLAPLYPLWESQEHVLAQLAKLEYEHWQANHPDGCLLDILKARQLGVTTFGQAVVAHRILTAPYTMSLLAADAPEQSFYMFAMLELTLEQSPPYFHPGELMHPKVGPLRLKNGSVVTVESGRTMRGTEMEDHAGSRGQLGVGKTYSCNHLSEIATWPYPEMMDSSLLPAIPRAPSSFCIRESTAQGRNNYWHQQWQLGVKGLTRFLPIFIPWFIEKTRYWLPVPEGWQPNPAILAYVKRAEANAPRWLGGKSIRISKEQVFYYETERTAAEARDQLKPGALAYFLANYPADPEESFQHSGRSIFGPALVERLKQHSRDPQVIAEIMPMKDLAELKKMQARG